MVLLIVEGCEKRSFFFQDLARLQYSRSKVAVEGPCLQQHNCHVRTLLITAMLLAVRQLSCSGVAHYCDAAGSKTVVMFGRCPLLRCCWQ